MNESTMIKSSVTINKDKINGLMQTVRNLYMADDIPWVIGYSGGKDSTATLQLVWLALRELPKDKWTLFKGMERTMVTRNFDKTIGNKSRGTYRICRL